MKLETKKSFAGIVFFMSILVFLNSCGDSSRIFKCDSDIDLGFIEMTNETKSYFPYTGNEKIILKNQNNEEITLVKYNAVEPIEKELSYTAAELCNEGVIDKQLALYNTKRLNSLYENKGKRQMSFYFDAHISARGETKSSLGIYDYMNIGSMADSTKGVSFSRNSQFRGDTSKKNLFPILVNYVNMSFVSDTIIGNKSYKNVITAQNARHSLSIAQNKGLIAMKFDNELWVVDRIE